MGITPPSLCAAFGDTRQLSGAVVERHLGGVTAVTRTIAGKAVLVIRV
jgi:hypothetical protein